MFDTRAAHGGYLPISAYGVIGNLRTMALVGRDGSIDWCCLPALDCPSVFGALLDRERGGRFRVAPAGATLGVQRYRDDTCVLVTRWDVDTGILLVSDFMPLRGTIIGAEDPDTSPELYRLLSCLGGEVTVDVAWSPRFQFAAARVRIERVEGGYLASAGDERMLLAGVPEEGEVVEVGGGPELRVRLRLRAGERRALVARYAATDVRHAPSEVEPGVRMEEVVKLLRETCATWVTWAHDNEERPTQDWAGEWSELVTRSELTLKMLTHPDTGAIAAAATTSLPEDLGGVRNWDYRFCWVRDASYAVQALLSLGHSAEAHDFINFIQRAVGDGNGDDLALQIMYGLHGERDLEERELRHLRGYRASSPVRVGNAAAGQRQHDSLGEMLDAAYELVRRGQKLERDDWPFLRRVADHACATWREPDSGIWEIRDGEHHFVHSKVMLWAGLDRAARMVEEHGFAGDAEGWRRSCDAIRELVMREGYDADVGAFTMRFGSDALDAAALRYAVEEFVAGDDPRMISTIDRIRERLMENGLVYRYRVDDGLPGGEGAFALCTFWMVDALTLAGRLDEAYDVFEGLMNRANHVGLFAEQIDPRSGEFLGNFPQAFSHLGVVNSALYLAAAEGRPIPDHARLMGMREPHGKGR